MRIPQFCDIHDVLLNPFLELQTNVVVPLSADSDVELASDSDDASEPEDDEASDDSESEDDDDEEEEEEESSEDEESAPSLLPASTDAMVVDAPSSSAPAAGKPSSFLVLICVSY